MMKGCNQVHRTSVHNWRLPITLLQQMCSCSNLGKMGCSTSHVQHPHLSPITMKPGMNDSFQNVRTPVYISTEQAVVYIKDELGITDDDVTPILLSLTTNDEGMVTNRDVITFCDKVKNVKEDLEKRFHSLDPSGLGQVSHQQAAELLSQQFPGFPMQFIKTLLTHYDHNGDGMVDFTEFVEFYAKIKAKKEDLDRTFSELDTDESGNLNAEELVHIIAENCAIEEFIAMTLIQEFDHDGNGTLDKEEFIALWTDLFG